MSRRRWVSAALAVTLAPPLAVLGAASPGQAVDTAQLRPRQLTPRQQVRPDGVVHGTKSTASQLARTDPTLLDRAESTPVSIVVKLDHDSVAAYTSSTVLALLALLTLVLMHASKPKGES